MPPHPALTGWHASPGLLQAHPVTSLLVIATIVATIGLAAALVFSRPRKNRRRGPVYSFPKRLSEREALHTLGKVSALQIAILKFIVDGYFEGVDPAEVAAHFRIKPREAAKHLTVLHRLGLLYVKRNAGGKANFYLIESVMARIGEPRFFNLIGLPSFA